MSAPITFALATTAFVDNSLSNYATNSSLLTSTNFGTTATGPLNIGTNTQTITTNSTQVVNNIKLLDGTIMQNVVGNANNVASYSITFNRKNLSTTTETPCYKVTSTGYWISQLMELTVSGTNNLYGPLYL